MHLQLNFIFSVVQGLKATLNEHHTGPQASMEDDFIYIMNDDFICNGGRLYSIEDNFILWRGRPYM